MKVPLLDLKQGYEPLREALLDTITEVVDQQRFIMGHQVEALEEAIAGYVGVAHAIACASGSDALLLALMALEIGPGDEVITTPYTFFSTAGAIARLGARPIFVDIDLDTYNLDVSLIEGLATSRTRAILPVHLFGQCADMERIKAIAAQLEVAVVEDAAQALGGRWMGTSAGSWGDMGCFSFFPSKNLGGFGDGGLVTTNDDGLADVLRALRAHGAKKKYHHYRIGINSRLDALQAAVLRVKLPHLDSWHANRQHNACRYYALCEEYKLLDIVTLPIQNLKAAHVYNQFVIRIPKRDELALFLKERGIGTAIYYPGGLHIQPCFAHLGYDADDFPNTNEAARSTLALPVFPELEDDQLRYVVSTIADFYGLNRRAGVSS